MMAMINQSAWHGQEHNMSSPGEDEFHQFFDIGMSNMGSSMHFDFQDFNSQNSPSIIQHPHRDSIDTPMSDANVSPIAAHDNMDAAQGQVPSMASALGHSTVPSQILPSQSSPDNAISQIDAQICFLQHQRLQQQQRQLEVQQRRLQEQQAAFYAQQQQQQRSMVPPTPQSMELQVGGQYYAPQDQGHSSGLFETYQQVKEQQEIAFTPLASPAVTPLDTHFPVDHQFMIPSSYFSPISSPALHAQVDSAWLYDPRHSSHTTNSPAADVESPTVPTTGDCPPKEVRKNSLSKRKSKVRQSPITRPQRKRMASTPVMNAQALSELAEVVGQASDIATKPKSASVSSNEGSENASVSPEALEMPPPPLPLPRSARPSPRIVAQNSDNLPPVPLLKSQNEKPEPATPASLFRISPRNQTADQSHGIPVPTENIDSFQLPESINSISRPEPQAPAQIKVQPPRMSISIETPKIITQLRSLPSTRDIKSAPLVSASPSPQLNPRPSSSASKKTPLMAAKNSRKRSSISAVSPALLPKISPNIKPLLPGTSGLSSEDSTSMLLASKSNYQRILEGSTVPGITYPSELSTNLTSKRTSHKIAEQGRRNRINSALQEIATLLPRGTLKESSEGDGDEPIVDKADGKQQLSAPNSKASTVESAIEYIKFLQKELAAANKRAEEAEEKLRDTK